MVKIRLSRGGAKHRPFYYIVVTDSRSPRDGRNIESLGYFNPLATPTETRVQINFERVKYWVSVGAQLSERVQYILKEHGEHAAAAA